MTSQFITNDIMVKSKNKTLSIFKYKDITRNFFMEMTEKNDQGRAYSELDLTSLLTYL